MKTIIVLNEADNVGNAIEDIGKGDQVVYYLDEVEHSLTATSDIPFGFKAALCEIPAGGPIIKYKETIGLASRAIEAGECVHVHNVEGNRGRGDLAGEAS